MILTISTQLFDMLECILICAVMPTLIVWFSLNMKQKKFEKRVELAKMAFEKNPAMDMEAFVDKLTPRKKTYAEKSIGILLTSLILLFLGAGCGVLAIIFNKNGIEDGWAFFGIISVILLGIGLSFLIYYIVIRRQIGKGIIK